MDESFKSLLCTAVVVSLGILPYTEWSDTFLSGRSVVIIGVSCELLRS